jgi:hypothetical protein
VAGCSAGCVMQHVPLANAAVLAAVNSLHIKSDMVYFVDSSRKPVQKFCDDF